MRRLIAFTRVVFRSQSIYIIDFWVGILSTYIMMYGMYSLWRVLYTQSPNAFGVNIKQMTTYGVMSILLQTVNMPSVKGQTYIAQQVRTGLLALDILKPIGFVRLMLLRNSGEFLVQLFLRGVPCFVFAYLILDIHIPTGRTLFGFAISLLLGYFISFFFNLLMGMLSTLTIDIRSYSWAFNALITFASGQLVPIWMFPDRLATLLTFLPFQAIYFLPLSIYVGNQGAYGEALLIQMFWSMTFYIFAILMWRQVYKRLTIQGG